jgi:SAM-dependent methyltransferase
MPRTCDVLDRRSAWSLADSAHGSDNAALVAELLPDLSGILNRACGVGAADRVLRVTDDAANLRFADDGFDVVQSHAGIISAGQHRSNIDEMLRVLRPGGTFGLLSWTTEGFMGQLLERLNRHAPPPALAGAEAEQWGRVADVRRLLGKKVTEFSATIRTVSVSRFREPVGFRDYVKAHHGPTRAAYRAISGDANRVAELDRDLMHLIYRARSSERGASMNALQWEYLLITARKR